MKTVDYSETTEACDLKVGRYRQLNDFMKVQVYLIITLSLGSIEEDRVISETVL